MAPMWKKERPRGSPRGLSKSSSGKTPQSETGEADLLKSPYRSNICWGTAIHGKR